MDFNKKFIDLRKKIMEKEFSHLNEMQQKAVFITEGPLLILAGAGSGKTTVLINRIANMVKFGKAYYDEKAPSNITKDDISFLEKMVKKDKEEITKEEDERIVALCAVEPCLPWQILAITFTNKAAGELKGRISSMLGEVVGNEVQASTFHSFCAMLLRVNADLIGYPTNFTIYDSDDSRRLIKECMRQLNINEKTLGHRAILREISRAKDSLITPSVYKEFAEKEYDARKKEIAKCYTLYQSMLKAAGAMDFDDLLTETVFMLRGHTDILEKYKNRYRYMMVDEYQDTNKVQYELVSLLASGSKNLGVVGDDDQSIYKFRGATIENILNFEEDFENAKIIRLEQNYRSTQNILAAANSVIDKNENRKSKVLWTENPIGELVSLHTLDNEDEEGKFIVEKISDEVVAGRVYSDFAILYRANAQSNALERAFVKSGIPYRILGGHRFYDRLEIRDVMAYLRVIENPYDIISLRRIINNPKRGIGDVTINRVAEISEGVNLSSWEILTSVSDYPDLSRAENRINEFVEMMQKLKDMAKDPEISLHTLYTTMLEDTGYLEMWESEGMEGEGRVENLQELASSILDFEKNNLDSENMLSDFLEETALMTDVDNYDEGADTVVMMTMHAAKGLEFSAVFLPGFEEGVFPGMQTIMNPEDLEEDRRLCYVAFTRAKEELYILKTESRMLYGSTTRNRPSRFLVDIPAQLVSDHGNPNSIFQMNELGSGAFGSNSIFSAAGGGSSYMKQKARRAKMGIGDARAAVRPRSDKPQWVEGDKVNHKVFGDGEIISAKPMGNDILVEIQFAKETKKIMANFAKLERLE